MTVGGGKFHEIGRRVVVKRVLYDLKMGEEVIHKAVGGDEVAVRACRDRISRQVAELQEVWDALGEKGEL